MVRISILFLLLTFTAGMTATRISAMSEQAVIGMPITGKWSYNAEVNPPYVDECPNGQKRCPGLSSHPAVHSAPGKGDWAIDVYVPEKTIPEDVWVKLNVVQATGKLEFRLMESRTSCGDSIRVSVWVDEIEVGWIYFAHINLDSQVKKGKIVNGMTIGTMKTFYREDGSVCNPGTHAHIEFKNTNNYSCYIDHGKPGQVLNESKILGILGSDNTNKPQPCVDIPSTGATADKKENANLIPLGDYDPSLQGSKENIQDADAGRNIQGPGTQTSSGNELLEEQPKKINLFSKIIRFLTRIKDFFTPVTLVNATTCDGGTFSFVPLKGYQVNELVKKCSSNGNIYKYYEMVKKDKEDIAIISIQEFVPRGIDKPDVSERINMSGVNWLLRIYKPNDLINEATKNAWLQLKVCQEDETAYCITESEQALYKQKISTGMNKGLYASMTFIGADNTSKGMPEFGLKSYSVSDEYIDDFKSLVRSVKNTKKTEVD